MDEMTLEEAFAAATVDVPSGMVDDIFVIDAPKRKIIVPDSESVFGVETDMDVERKYFRCPRIVGDNIDLYAHKIYVVYVTAKDVNGTFLPEIVNDKYWCDDVAVDGDCITFSWVLSDNVLSKSGIIAFKILAATTENGLEKTRWNTAPAYGTILMTVPDGDDIAERYPDIVTQLLERMDAVEAIATEEAMQGYVNEYLREHPVVAGATEEQAAQIDQNTQGISALKGDIDNELNLTKIEVYLANGAKISVNGKGISFGGDLNVIESGEKYSFSVESIVSLAVEYGFTATDDGKGFVGNDAWFLYFNTETKTLEFYNDFKNSKFLYPIYWYRYGNIGGKLSDFNRQSNLKSIGIDIDKIEADIKILNTKSNVSVYLSNYNDFEYDGNKLTFNSDVVIRPLSRNDDTKRFTPENILDEAEVFGFTVDRSNKSITGSDRFGFYFDISTNKIGFTESWIYDANKVILFFYSYRTVFGKLVDYYNTQKSKSNTLKLADLETKLTNNVPSYFVNHLNEKIEIIRRNMMEVGRHGETFIFITDIHWDTSERNSPYLIREILNQAYINTLLCGGDLINEGTYDEMRKDMGECVRSYNYPNTFFPVAFGNHDSNKNNGNPESEHFDEDAEYALMQKQAENYITYWSNGWNFYFDVKPTKTRYIVVDTNENGSFAQYSDLYEVLTGTDADYHIVICGHWFFNNNAKSAFTNDLETIIDAYNSKSTITVANTNMNFSNAKAEICFVIGGHVHNDITWNTPNGIPFILSDCDNGRRTKNTEYPYVKGTITEHAFDVVTIDYTNRTIKSVRVGRGIDREWSY